MDRLVNAYKARAQALSLALKEMGENFFYLFTALRSRNSGAPVTRPPESCWLAA
jgi:hypothetical protein